AGGEGEDGIAAAEGGGDGSGRVIRGGTADTAVAHTGEGAWANTIRRAGVEVRADRAYYWTGDCKSFSLVSVRSMDCERADAKPGSPECFAGSRPDDLLRGILCGNSDRAGGLGRAPLAASAPRGQAAQCPARSQKHSH